jgi:hypothetical protein
MNWLQKLIETIKRLIADWKPEKPEPTPTPTPTPDPAPAPQPDPPSPPPASNPPDPSRPEKYKSGFLWKPIGDGNRPLVVLLPSAFTGHTGKRATLTESNGTAHVASIAGQPANGNREHYRYARPGGGYASPATISVSASGKTWTWTIPNTSNRYDGNLTPGVR